MNICFSMPYLTASPIRYVPLIDTTPSAIVIRFLNVVAVFIFQLDIVSFLPSKVFKVSYLNKRQLKSE